MDKTMQIYFHAKRNYSNYLIKHCNLKLLLSECEKFSIIFFDFHTSRYKYCQKTKTMQIYLLNACNLNDCKV